MLSEQRNVISLKLCLAIVFFEKWKSQFFETTGWDRIQFFPVPRAPWTWLQIFSAHSLSDPMSCHCAVNILQPKCDPWWAVVCCCQTRDETRESLLLYFAWAIGPASLGRTFWLFHLPEFPAVIIKISLAIFKSNLRSDLSLGRAHQYPL